MQMQFKQCMLTYAQCDIDPFLIVDRLAELKAECIVGKESHSDGGTHYHVYCQWEEKFRSRNARIFDILGHHPNVAPCRFTPKDLANYAMKDGDIVAGGLNIDDIDEHPSGHKGGSDVWSIITNADTEEEFWRLAGDLAPRQLACNFNSLHSFAKWKYKPVEEPYESPYTEDQYDLSAYPEIAAWRDTHLRNNDPHVRGKSLVLWGGTRTGKTEWARCLGRHAYFCGMWSLDEPTHDVQYAIFDDLVTRWSQFDFLKPWIGQQKQMWVTDKYRGKRKIEWGKPVIILTQYDPRDHLDVDQEWLAGNAVIVHVNSSLIRQTDMDWQNSSWEM